MAGRLAELPHLTEAGLVCFPEGPAGAHRLLNRGESVVRALFSSTTGLPANVCYPDTGHWLIRNGLGPDEVVVRETGPLVVTLHKTLAAWGYDQS